VGSHELAAGARLAAGEETESGGAPIPDRFRTPPRAAARRAAADLELLDAYSRAVVGVVERAGPAVLSVSVRGRPAARLAGRGFRLPGRPDGYVLTNSHVVHRAPALTAHLPGGEELAAQVVGDDSATDLALIRVTASALPFLAVDGATRARPGQLAIAIGRPARLRIDGVDRCGERASAARCAAATGGSSTTSSSTPRRSTRATRAGRCRLGPAPSSASTPR